MRRAQEVAILAMGRDRVGWAGSLLVWACHRWVISVWEQATCILTKEWRLTACHSSQASSVLAPALLQFTVKCPSP